MPVTVEIDPTTVLGEVSPNIYGHFTEHLVTVIYDGLWAELLYGRKFESPMVGRADHGIAQPWQPFAATPGVTYFRGPEPTPRHAPAHRDAHHAQSVDVPAGHDGAEVGISQTPVPFDAGVTYVFRGMLRRRGPSGPIRIALRGADGTVLADNEVDVPNKTSVRFGSFASAHETLFWMDDSNWTEVSCELTPTATDLAGTFTITFTPEAGERTTFWADWVSLMPKDAYDGWHAGLVDGLRDLPARLLKWPGGCMADAYDWREGVGPRDSRHCTMDQAWLGWEENDVGTDEYLHLCRLLGTEPMIGVNAGNGTPEMAAAWVEYCNGAVDTEYGARRAANGHPEPYNVRYWVVGNEQWGHFERGYVGPEKYGERFLQFAEAMRKVDPSITLAAVGKAGEFNVALLPVIGGGADELQIHIYSDEVPVVDDASATAKIKSAVRFVDEVRQIRNEVTAAPETRTIRIAVDEWGWSRPNHAGAVYIAATLNAFHNEAPFVASACRTCVVQADGLLDRVGNTIVKQPAYEAYRLYNQAHLPAAVLAHESTFEDHISVSCLTDPGTGRYSLFVVNALAEPEECVIDGLPVAEGTAVVVDRLVATEAGPAAAATSAVTTEETWAPTWTLPPHSLTVIRVGG